MTDLDAQVALLLRAGTADLGSDPAPLVAGGLARGRRVRRRRRAGTALAAVAVAVVAGVGFSLGGGDVRTAVDPVQPAEQTSAAPAPASARPLAIEAADLPALLAQLMPGEVTVAPAGPGADLNPMDGFDPRLNAATAVFPRTEPGPGVYADLRWDGVPVVLSVAPSEPSYGATAMERCVGGGEGGNGTCVATPDGGASQETSFASGGAQVQVVSRWTPDLWEISVMSQGTGATPSIAQLEAVVGSDVWFGQGSS